MNIKQATIYTLTTLLLTACNHTSTTNVEHRDLIRSMIYTQRHLIDLELSTQPFKETDRHAILLQSHCDLIHRNFVHSKTPAQCPSPADSNIQLCIAAFHRCIGQCPTFKQDCERCEQQITQCLATEPSP